MRTDHLPCSLVRLAQFHMYLFHIMKTRFRISEPLYPDKRDTGWSHVTHVEKRYATLHKRAHLEVAE